MQAVVDDQPWTTHAVNDGSPVDTYRARELFRKMADAAWVCGDPGIQYDTTINDWNPVSNSDRQYATNPCVTGDTLVATDEGWQSIESLVGQTVNVIGADGQPHTVDRVFPTGRKPIFELKTRSGYRVRITADHKVATARGDVAVKDLTTEDTIQLRGPASAAESIIASARGGDRPGGRRRLPDLDRADDAEQADGRPDHAPRGGGRPRRGRGELNAQKHLLKAVGSVGRNDDVHVSFSATGSRLAFASRPVVELFMQYAVLDEGSSLKRFKPAVHELDRASLAGAAARAVHGRRNGRQIGHERLCRARLDLARAARPGPAAAPGVRRQVEALREPPRRQLRGSCCRTARAG